MSKMNDLILDIKDLIDTDMSFVQVARELGIPVHFVIEANDLMIVAETQQDFDPFATINS